MLLRTISGRCAHCDKYPCQHKPKVGYCTCENCLGKEQTISLGPRSDDAKCLFGPGKWAVGYKLEETP